MLSVRPTRAYIIFKSADNLNTYWFLIVSSFSVLTQQ